MKSSAGGTAHALVQVGNPHGALSFGVAHRSTGTPLFHGITAEDVEATVTGLIDLSLVERADPREPECVRLHPVIREANHHQPDVRENLSGYPALCLSVLDGFTTGVGFDTPAELALWAVLGPLCEHGVG